MKRLGIIGLSVIMLIGVGVVSRLLTANSELEWPFSGFAQAERIDIGTRHLDQLCQINMVYYVPAKQIANSLLEMGVAIVFWLVWQKHRLVLQPALPPVIVGGHGNGHNRKRFT
jgi:hypothetical protein